MLATTVTVTVPVTNTGSRAGDEVVQVYLRDARAAEARVRAAGVPFYVEPRETWRDWGDRMGGQQEFLVQDPDGYLVMVVERIGERVCSGNLARCPVPARRLATIRRLTEAGIPVRAMLAPVVPGLTDHELEAILEAAAEAGATHATSIPLRLPREVVGRPGKPAVRALPQRALRRVVDLLAVGDVVQRADGGARQIVLDDPPGARPRHQRS